MKFEWVRTSSSAYDTYTSAGGHGSPCVVGACVVVPGGVPDVQIWPVLQAHQSLA